MLADEWECRHSGSAGRYSGNAGTVRVLEFWYSASAVAVGVLAQWECLHRGSAGTEGMLA